jgi:outer membrane protein assembly factor BamD (BamD/ComL family)
MNVESSVISRRVSGALNLAVGFNPRDGRRNVPASRQRRLNSIVADATREKNRGLRRGLKPTAKFKRRSAAEKAMALCAMAIVLGASLSIRGSGQEPEAAQQFVQSANSSDAAQKLLREGRELVGERKWDAAKAKFDNLIRAYPRDKNLDAALYWLAFCLKQQGRPRESDQTLERLIKEYPRSDWGDDARTLRLELADALGDLDAARKVLEREQKTVERNQKSIEREQKTIEREQKTVERDQKIVERDQKTIEREQKTVERNRRNLDKDDPNEALRLIALQSLFQADPERAMSVAAGFLSQDSKTSATIQEAALGLIARHGGEKAWPALLETARNQSIAESLREQAIYWIAQQNREQAAEALVQLYDGEKTAELKERLLYWLAQSDNGRAKAKIVEVARGDNSSELRERAIYWVAQRGGEQSFGALNELYGAEKDSAIKDRILYWFAQSEDPRAQARIVEIARSDNSSELRDRAVYWVAQRKGEESTDALIRLYDEQKEEETKERILYWLGQRGGKAGLQKLLAVAKSDSPQNLRERAIYYLGQSKDPEAIKLLEQIFK